VRFRTESAADRRYIVRGRHHEDILMEKKAPAAWRGDLRDGISAWIQRVVARACCAINKQFAVFVDKIDDSRPIPAFLNASISLHARLVS
jgi:hypothetical protein